MCRSHTPWEIHELCATTTDYSCSLIHCSFQSTSLRRKGGKKTWGADSSFFAAIEPRKFWPLSDSRRPPLKASIVNGSIGSRWYAHRDSRIGQQKRLSIPDFRSSAKDNIAYARPRAKPVQFFLLSSPLSKRAAEGKRNKVVAIWKWTEGGNIFCLQLAAEGAVYFPPVRLA